MTTTDNEPPTWGIYDKDPQPSEYSIPTGSPGHVPAAKVALRPSIKTYRHATAIDKPVSMLVHIDLTRTTVYTNGLVYNTTDKKGYFTDKVTLKAFFDGTSDFTVHDDMPSTTSEGGAVSTTVSFSADGGFFGTDGTFSMGGSVSSGASQTLPDFEVRNLSDPAAGLVKHIYELRLVAGAAYHSPTDAFIGALPSGAIRLPPARATESLPLMSNVIFMSPSKPEGVKTLVVEIVQRLMLVEKTFGASLARDGTRYDQSRTDEPQSFYVPWPLGRIRIDVSPLLLTSRWRFDVDCDTGEITYG